MEKALENHPGWTDLFNINLKGESKKREELSLYCENLRC